MNNTNSQNSPNLTLSLWLHLNNAPSCYTEHYKI